MQRVKLIFHALVLHFVVTLQTGQVHGYVLEGQKWPDGNIVMYLRLGSISGTLIDGGASWDAVAENALADWNQYISRVQFTYVVDATSSTQSGDGKNSAFWSSNVFGMSFGSSTLAITQRYFIGSKITEADVVFNNTKPWNSYRGNLRTSSNQGQYLNDFRRVAIHEFGHVLGLGHPDEDGQTVVAQMNSVESNLDDLAPDDIAGAQNLYGVKVSNKATLTLLASPSNAGAASGGGTYDIGSTVQISTTAYTGFTFTGWNDGNATNPRTVTVPAGGVTYTAYFAAVPVPLIITDAVAQSGGWYSSKVFGAYNGTVPGWIWHLQHGWLYVDPSSTSSAIFLYSVADAGWLGTSMAWYPTLYRFSDGAWLYYLKGTSNPRWFYNYKSAAWEQR